MTTRVQEKLLASGLSPAAAATKNELFVRNLAVLSEHGTKAEAATHHYYVPGRLEVVGKHTDYAGGRSLLCSVERGVCISVRPRKDRRVCVTDVQRDYRGDFTIAEHLPVVPDYWLTYPIIVARRLARNFPGILRGADIAFTSDLPQAAGMSSSSALVVAFFLALSRINELGEKKDYRRSIRATEDLAGYLGAIEHGLDFGTLAGDTGVNVTGGSEGQAAMLLSQPDELGLFSFLPLQPERSIPFPKDHVFAIAVSGVRAAKGGDAFVHHKRTVGLANSVLDVWNRSFQGTATSLASALEHDPVRANALRAAIRDDDSPAEQHELLLARLDHFLAESDEIVPAASEAVAIRDFDRLGELAALSQANAERLLGNQVPETIALARSARELGALASSSFGAGFGGSVWALVEKKHSASFVSAWREAYRHRHPHTAASSEFFLTRPGTPVIEVETGTD